MEHPLAEFFLVGQFSVRLVMCSGDHEMEICQKRGLELLTSINAPQDVRDGFSSLYDPELDRITANREESAHIIEKNLEHFMTVYAQWCETHAREQGIKTFNLGFCLFMAIFYSNLSQNNRQKFLPPLKDNLKTVLTLAESLNLETEEITNTLSLFNKGDMTTQLSKIANQLTKFFLIALKGLGGGHLMENAGLIDW